MYNDLGKNEDHSYTDVLDKISFMVLGNKCEDPKKLEVNIDELHEWQQQILVYIYFPIVFIGFLGTTLLTFSLTSWVPRLASESTQPSMT